MLKFYINRNTPIIYFFGEVYKAQFFMLKTRVADPIGVNSDPNPSFENKVDLDHIVKKM